MSTRYHGAPYGRYPAGGRFYGGRGYRPYFRISPEEEQRIWEDQQKKKEVIQQGVKGKVKWYSFRKNYGFIQRDDDSQDVFVHQYAIVKSRIRKVNLRTLGDGEIVQFDVVHGKKGLEASNVTGPDGTEVQGSRIIFVYTDNYYDRFNNRGRSPYYRDNRSAPVSYPSYYNNYRQQPPIRNDRDFRPRDDRVARYDNTRSRYPANRDRSYPDNRDRSYPDNRDRSYPSNRGRPYQGNRGSYRGNRDHGYSYRGGRGRPINNSRQEQPKPNDKQVEVKEAVEVEKKETKNDTKKDNGFRRGRGGGGRRFYRGPNKKIPSEGTTPVQSTTSVNETSKETSGETAKLDSSQATVAKDIVDKSQDPIEDASDKLAAVEIKN